MKLKEKVVLLMDKQSQTVKKNKVFQVESENALDELGIPRDSEFYYFYSHYFAQITFARRKTAPEMADCICPDKALKVFSTFAHESWQILFLPHGQVRVGICITFWTIPSGISIWANGNCWVQTKCIIGTASMNFWFGI